MSPLMRRVRAVALAGLGLAFGVYATAAPYVPADDAQVLERLPERTTAQNLELKQLRAQLAVAPNSVTAATALANAYYLASRKEGDPRYLGYAQAALAPWWNVTDAPMPVLVTRATILQSSHVFDRALADLGAALAREPRNARARLVRATVLTVQGKYAEARQDCPRLFGVAPEIFVVDCLAAIDSLTGKAQQAAATIERALAALPRTAADDGRVWSESLLGEIRYRLGDPAAEQHFRAALAADPRDLYTLGAYADWLLDNNRAPDVLPLVRNEFRVDALLLRRALAQKALQSPETPATIATLRARFDAVRARGDIVHRREAARFELHLNGDPQTALRLARENWGVQRESADLRILAEAAAATGDAGAQETVRRWLADTGLEYPLVARLVQAGAGGAK